MRKRGVRGFVIYFSKGWTHIMRLGVITTGQGPRNEYAAYHRGLAAALGMQIDVIDEHILDGLSWEEIKPHLGTDEEDRLGAHVHVPGATGNRLGEGWDHVYVRLAWALPYFQAAIDRLVGQGADMVLFCCATRFPDTAFTCPVPLIKPATLMLAAVTERIHTAGPATRSGAQPLRFGLMSSVGHGRQDVQLWRDQPFAAQLAIDYEPFEGNILPAAQKLAARDHDLVVVWSYGLGMAASDGLALSARLEQSLRCPVLMPHRVAALHALGLMTAGFDDRAFLAAGSR